MLPTVVPYTPPLFIASLHDALPISSSDWTSSTSYATWCILGPRLARNRPTGVSSPTGARSSTRPEPTSTAAASTRSEEHTSELQSPCKIVCRHLHEKKIYKRKSTKM